jgi:hypothetical protein
MPIVQCPHCPQKIEASMEQLASGVYCRRCERWFDPLGDGPSENATAWDLGEDAPEPAATDGSPCPYCQQGITPPPKRARKCPHCGTKFYVRQGRLYTEDGVRQWEEQFGSPMKFMSVAEQNEYRRKDTARQLAMHKQLGSLLWGMQICRTEDAFCCDYCRAQHGRVIPKRECTLDALPPFSECTNRDDGCRCSFTPVLKPRT